MIFIYSTILNKILKKTYQHCNRTFLLIPFVIILIFFVWIIAYTCTSKSNSGDYSDLIIQNGSFIYEANLPNVFFNKTKKYLYVASNYSTIDFIGPFLSVYKYHKYFFSSEALYEHKSGQQNVEYYYGNSTFSNRLFYEEFQIITLKNIFVTTQCIYYDQNTNDFLIPRKSCQDKFNFTFPLHALYKNMMGNTISLCHAFSSNYAHMIFDVLPPLTVMNTSIIQTSNFLVNETFSYVYDLLDNLFNIQKEKIICLRHNTFLLCETIMTINPHPFYKIYGTLLKKLRNVFVLKFGLDISPPKKFVVFNRKLTRRIANFGPLYYEILVRFPQYKWEMRKKLKGLQETSKYYNEILFLFGPHGADFANTIFMQEDTVVSEIHGDEFVSCYLYFSNYLGFHHLVMRIPEMGIQLLLDTNIAPIEIAIQMIKKGLSYIENSKKYKL